MASRPRTFLDHLHELRTRLLVSGGAFLIGGIVGYLFHKSLLLALDRSSHQTLYYTTPTGAFNLVMKMCVMLGIVFLLPVLTYNLMAFVQPALKKHFSRRQLLLVSLLSLMLAISGAIFAYFVIVPMSLHFFGSYRVAGIQPLISANEYLDFITNHILTFIIMFQIPLVILFIDRIKPLPPKMFLKYERHIIIGSLVIALVLPFTYDPFTEFLVAVPMIVLYNLSIILVVLAHRSRRRSKTAREPALQATDAAIVPVPVAAVPIAQPAAVVATTVEPTPKRAAVMDVRRSTVPRQNYLQRGNYLDLRKPSTSAD
jgi:sec-independent protein translocase protein TatC